MQNAFRMTGCAGLGLLVLLTAAWQGHAQEVKAAYPSMAPLEQYLMERGAEIALARSAAPPSVAADAGVLLLGKHGYETAAESKNGFVCLVERSWTAGFDDPQFWNPKLRGPICYNAAAARSYLVLMVKRTELVLAGGAKDQIAKTVSAAIDKKEWPGMEPGAMCYMLSKEGYLSDRGGHWHPHLMFFIPLTDLGSWGANVPGSPVLGAKDEVDRVAVFMVPVSKWSDGTADTEH